MTKVFADTSSIILLEKASLFSLVLSSYEIMMPESVFDELTSNNDPDEVRFKKNLKENRFFVSPFDPVAQPDILSSKYQLPKKLDRGEKDLIRLYLSKPAGFILTDDGAAAKYCDIQKIPFINALLVPKIFWYAGIINLADCTAHMDLILKIGRYADPIARYAKECTFDDLKQFLPEL